MLANMIRLIQALNAVGGKWSIENPAQSFLWKTPQVQSLFDDSLVHSVRFQQCMFGLAPLDDPLKRLRKDTLIVTSVSSLSGLARSCDRTHAHGSCIGSGVVNGKRFSRAKKAGAYPIDLCRLWAKLVGREFLHAARFEA